MPRTDEGRRQHPAGRLHRPVIGTCTRWRLEPQNRRCEIGFALGREHWGQGIMSEALAVLCDFAFTELGLHRLEADVDPENEASIALLERLGFRQEGHLRERWLVGGRVCDSLIYGLLAGEWRRAAGAPVGWNSQPPRSKGVRPKHDQGFEATPAPRDTS